MKLCLVAASGIALLFANVALAQSKPNPDARQDQVVQQQDQSQVAYDRKNDAEAAREDAVVNRQLAIARRTHNPKDMERAKQLAALRDSHVRAAEQREAARQQRLNHLTASEAQRDKKAHNDPSH